MGMKTPEEIKRGLGCCLKGFCTSCAYEKILNCTESVREDARALIQQLEAQVPKWIGVEERLPEDEIPVLVGYSRNLDGFISIGYLDHEDMRWCGIDGIRIARPSHWMPLPEPPKEEEEK